MVSSKDQSPEAVSVALARLKQLEGHPTRYANDACNNLYFLSVNDSLQFISFAHSFWYYEIVFLLCTSTVPKVSPHSSSTHMPPPAAAAGTGRKNTKGKGKGKQGMNIAPWDVMIEYTLIISIS